MTLILKKITELNTLKDVISKNNSFINFKESFKNQNLKVSSEAFFLFNFIVLLKKSNEPFKFCIKSFCWR